MWSEEEAKKTVEAIFPYVDFLFVSEETSRRMLQRTGTLEEIMKGYADTYGCTLIATTRREAVSPTHHNFNSKIYMNGNFYEEEPYNNIEVIDRIGSGDAYLAGVLYGLIKFGTPERAIEIGNALSAVKNTVAGDMSASSLNTQVPQNFHLNVPVNTLRVSFRKGQRQSHALQAAILPHNRQVRLL